MAHDLGPAADRMADLVRGITDEQLDSATPCTGYRVADLLDHVSTVAVGLARAARKEADAPPPLGDAANLEPGWRSAIPSQVEALVEAWREPGALEGTIEVGGIEMPAEAAFTVALEELVVHGWDLAVATAQPFDATDADLAVVRAFFDQFGPEMRGDAYGPEVDVAGDGSELHRLLAVSGRDPGWSA